MAIDAPQNIETSRFQKKRELILDTAAALINERGTKGMSLADVADAVKLSSTSITYYFRRKDLLAAACFDRSLDRLEEFVCAGEAEGDTRARVRTFVRRHFEFYARIRREEQPQVARLSDMRALEEPMRSELMERYLGLYRRVRRFFGTERVGDAHLVRTVRAHALLENLFWLPYWLTRYELADFPRVERRFFELLEHGVSPPGAVWRPTSLVLPEPGDELAEDARNAFLKAATHLINERGYRGASVERIAAELNVTKGSFYHHLDAKDDLVVDCFQRSLRTMRSAQDAGAALDESYWGRLAATVAALLEVQFSESAALLRSVAYQALPLDVRRRVLERANRVATRFAGLLIDGMSEGSIRLIDPSVASQTIMSTVNAAYELRAMAERWPRERMVALYASTLFFGILDAPPPSER